MQTYSDVGQEQTLWLEESSLLEYVFHGQSVKQHIARRIRLTMTNLKQVHRIPLWQQLYIKRTHFM